MNFYHCGIGAIVRILLMSNSRSCRRILVNFFQREREREREMGCFTGDKSYDFDADPDHDPDPGILTEFFYQCTLR